MRYDIPTPEEAEQIKREEAIRNTPLDCRWRDFDAQYYDWRTAYAADDAEIAAERFIRLYKTVVSWGDDAALYTPVPGGGWRQLQPRELYYDMAETEPPADPYQMVEEFGKLVSEKTRLEQLHNTKAMQWWRNRAREGMLPLATPRPWKFKNVFLRSHEVDELANHYGDPFGREALAVEGSAFGLKTFLVRRDDGDITQGWILPGIHIARPILKISRR